MVLAALALHRAVHDAGLHDECRAIKWRLVGPLSCRSAACCRQHCAAGIAARQPPLERSNCLLLLLDEPHGFRLLLRLLLQQ